MDNQSPSEPRFVRPIANKSSLAMMAYEAIRKAIVTGKIKPGERMGQVELAKELGVSERTVREAFARLVAKGLAVHEPYKGVRVMALPLEELREIYLIRAMVEGHAVEIAAEKISDDELHQMRALLPQTYTQGASGFEQAQEANHEFHWIAIRAGGSRLTVRLLEQLWEMMYAYDVLYQDPIDAHTTGERDLQQHQALLDALEHHDGKRAAQINSEHINSTMNTLLKHLRDQESNRSSSETNLD